MWILLLLQLTSSGLNVSPVGGFETYEECVWVVLNGREMLADQRLEGLMCVYEDGGEPT